MFSYLRIAVKESLTVSTGERRRTTRWSWDVLLYGIGTQQTTNSAARLAISGIALGLILAGELAVGIGLRGMTATEVFLDKDPVSGTAYNVSLPLFAAMPWIVSRR